MLQRGGCQPGEGLLNEQNLKHLTATEHFRNREPWHRDQGENRDRSRPQPVPQAARIYHQNRHKENQRNQTFGQYSQRESSSGEGGAGLLATAQQDGHGKEN